MHLSAAIPGGDPGEPPVICTTTFTHPLYPKPRLFIKNATNAPPGGKEVCFSKSKNAIFQKSSIEGLASFLPKYIVAIYATDGQLKGTEYKKNMKVVYLLFCHHFARTCSPTYPVLSKTETALVSSSSMWSLVRV